jgi:hypothetical protein
MKDAAGQSRPRGYRALEIKEDGRTRSSFSFRLGDEMKNFLWGFVALAILAVGPARAGDVVFKPIDTQKLVVQPSKIAASMAAKTISVVGQTAAGSIEQNGWVKTINNVFGRKIISPKTQAGPSALPTPNLFSSTQYRNFNTPLTPTTQPVRR